MTEQERIVQALQDQARFRNGATERRVGKTVFEKIKGQWRPSHTYASNNKAKLDNRNRAGQAYYAEWLGAVPGTAPLRRG
jgi:hypothetical protein